MLPPNPAVSAPLTELAVNKQIKVDETLTIEAPEWFEDFETGLITFVGGVKATYGPTILTCEKIIVNRNKKTFETFGQTKIFDPEGVVTADSVTTSWADGSKGATARNVLVEIGYVKIQGSTLTIVSEPEQVWTLTDVKFELSDLAGGGNRILARSLRIYPGKYGVAEHVFYQILGQKLGPIPKQSFNFDRRVSGIKLPSITNRPGVGLGVSWDSSVLLTDHSSLLAAWSTFPGQLPAYRVQYTTSPLAVENNATKLAPRDELGEPQADGWFNNIGIADPEMERSRLQTRKNSFSAGLLWNSSTAGRLNDGRDISKLFDFAYEAGGAIGEAGWITTSRIQRIREGFNTQWVDRGLVMGTFLAPDLIGGDQLSTQIRTDIFGTASSSNTFGYARGEFGLVWEPKKGIKIGAAYAVGGQTGTPDFLFEQLDFASAMLVRADYSIGPYTLRYLAKYDFKGQTWYDKEWEIALAAGSLEPFMVRREFPSDYRIGVRFRIDRFTNRLLERSVKR